MSRTNTYLVCVRNTRSGRYGAEPGDTSFLRVAAANDDFTPADAITRNRWRTSVIAAADGEEDEITGSTGDLLFFVNGYNTDTATVLWRTRTLQRTLTEHGWRGLVVGFDWPSDNSTLNYLEDRDDASKVAIRLVEEVLPMLIDGQFPADDGQPPCHINVHMLGHSTGAYVIMDAFANAAKKGEFFRKPWRIGQVAFIAGDVASSALAEHSEWARPMFDRIFRLTNYSNGFDRVLAVSNMKRLGTSPRAGRVGVPADAPRYVVDVDCAAHFVTKDPKRSEFSGTFNHSWHIGDPDFALDLAMTLEGEIDRMYLPTRRREGNRLHLLGGQSRPLYQTYWDSTGEGV